MIPFPLQEFDASKKNRQWFAAVIDELIVRKNWLVRPDAYHNLKEYAEGTFETKVFKKAYDLENKKEEDLDIDFQPLDVMGHLVENIISAIDEDEIDITALCTDALSTSREERDIELLKARKKIQPDLDKISRGLGLKSPLKFPDKVKIKGQEQDTFSSDISSVDKMKFNPEDEGDMEIFQDVYQRQHKEIAIEDAVEHYFKVSDVKEIIKKLVLDFLIHNSISGQNRMNHFSRQPDISYLAPYETFTIQGRRPDRKDADGMGWERAITIRQLFQSLGDELDLEDVEQILNLANNATGTTYNCIDGCENYFSKETREKWGTDGKGKESCSWTMFQEMRIGFGYIEIKSQNADMYEILEKYGRQHYQKIQYDTYTEHDIKKKKIEHRYYDVTYKAYYIPGLYDRCYGFGKVPMQMRFGIQGELTDFTIQVYVQRGQSIIKRCKPVLKHLCSLWYKFQYFIGQAMPTGEMWEIDSVRKLAMKVLEADGKTSSTEDVLRFLQSQTNVLYKSMNEDGSPVGGDGIPMKKRERGLDPSVKDIVQLMITDMNFIRGLIGNNLQAEQKTPPPNSPEKIAEMTINGDFSSNNFIISGIRKLLSNTATITGWYVQQIIDSDDEEAVESVTKAIGETNVKILKTFKGESPAKYSIFLTDTMTAMQKAELHQLINEMILKGTLPVGIGFQIKDIRSYKTATAVLGFQERRVQMLAQQKKQEDLNIELNQEAERTKLKISEINAKYQGELAKEKEITNRAVLVEQIRKGSKKELKIMGGAQQVVKDAHQSGLRQDEMVLENKMNPNGNPPNSEEQPSVNEPQPQPQNSAAA